MQISAMRRAEEGGISTSELGGSFFGGERGMVVWKWWAWDVIERLCEECVVFRLGIGCGCDDYFPNRVIFQHWGISLFNGQPFMSIFFLIFLTSLEILP